MDYDDFKYINKQKKENKIPKIIFNYIIKILCIIILMLGSLIYVKQSSINKKKYKKMVYTSTLSFAKIYNLYEKYLGDLIPFKNLFKNNTIKVSDEKITYDNIEKSGDGYILYIPEEYTMSAIKDGIVIKKDKNSITVQSKDNLSILYKGLSDINVSLYDYIEKGEILGISNNKIYLEFMKDDKYISYEKYL